MYIPQAFSLDRNNVTLWFTGFRARASLNGWWHQQSYARWQSVNVSGSQTNCLVNLQISRETDGIGDTTIRCFVTGLSSSTTQAEEWMDQAVNSPVELGERAPDRRETDKALYMNLAIVCNEALDLVKTATHKRGFESWRKLSQEYGTTTGTSLPEYTNLLEYDFGTKDGFKKRLLKWEIILLTSRKRQVKCLVTEWNVQLCCQDHQHQSERTCEFRIEKITELLRMMVMVQYWWNSEQWRARKETEVRAQQEERLQQKQWEKKREERKAKENDKDEKPAANSSFQGYWTCDCEDSSIDSRIQCWAGTKMDLRRDGWISGINHNWYRQSVGWTSVWQWINVDSMSVCLERICNTINNTEFHRMDQGLCLLNCGAQKVVLSEKSNLMLQMLRRKMFRWENWLSEISRSTSMITSVTCTKVTDVLRFFEKVESLWLFTLSMSMWFTLLMTSWLVLLSLCKKCPHVQ